MIILPNNPLFHQTLALAKSPDWREKANKAGEAVCMVADSSTGIMRPATYKEMMEYLEGGEYDERLQNAGIEE